MNHPLPFYIDILLKKQSTIIKRTMAHQVVLVLGAGKNVGSAAVSKFKSKGYKVAAVSRNPIAEVRQDADLVLSADFSDPNCFAGIFEQVEGALGLPNVVIYNGKLCA
jgi:NAD(P)-dependent dehydrogenase (short-subunit alcohol dehydrogenase family)